MPIQLVTGLPGNAKTLHTIGEVMKRAEKEGRQVYYHGIKDLNLDWEKIEPEKWMDCPDGSIIVIDECQKVFRNRTMGSVPPLHVTELEEHRHRGFDFYIITQHPSLIDPVVRRLVQTHKHMIRVMGMERSTVHKWNVCIEHPDKPSSRKDSEKEMWAFDKGLYGVYKSAEMHTVRRSIPMRVWGLLLVPVLLFAAGYAVYMLTVGKYKVDKPKVDQVAKDGQVVPNPMAPAPGQVPPDNRREEFDPIKDAQHFVQMNTPRVEGLQYTAPKYDEITRPTTAPVPAMCVQSRNACKCWSQQATPLDVGYNMCIEFARNGYFREFDPDRDRQDSERTARSVQVMEGHDRVPQNTTSASNVAVFTNPPPEAPYQPQVAGRGG